MIEARIVQTLVRAGREPEFEISHVPAELESIRSMDAINRLHWQDWDSVTRGMATEDVVALAKALTVCEERFRWLGGSVAAVIWVYREVERRNRDTAHDLADWILPRTSNTWAPFGSMNLGARSLREYRILSAAAAQQKTVKARLEGERAAAGKIKREHRKQAAVRREAEQTVAATERRAWMSNLASLPAAERLRRIADDNEHPLDYFPTSWANADDATIRSLDLDARRRLIDRLKNRRKGPWKRLHLALLMVSD